MKRLLIGLADAIAAFPDDAITTRTRRYAVHSADRPFGGGVLSTEAMC